MNEQQTHKQLQLKSPKISKTKTRNPRRKADEPNSFPPKMRKVCLDLILICLWYQFDLNSWVPSKSLVGIDEEHEDERDEQKQERPKKEEEKIAKFEYLEGLGVNANENAQLVNQTHIGWCLN